MTSRARSVAARLVAGAKQRAKRSNLPFDLKREDVTVPAFCPALGLRLRPGNGRPQDNSPTLDRIVPEKGYVKGNVIVVSMRANRLKSDATIQELRQIASFYDQLVH